MAGADIASRCVSVSLGIKIPALLDSISNAEEGSGLLNVKGDFSSINKDYIDNKVVASCRLTSGIPVIGTGTSGGVYQENQGNGSSNRRTRSRSGQVRDDCR